MKIIGKTSNGYIVEMSETEVARAAGYPYATTTDYVRKFSPNNAPRVGDVIDVAAAYDFHSRVERHQEGVKNAASTLRALASLLDQNLPSVVLPARPATEA